MSLSRWKIGFLASLMGIAFVLAGCGEKGGVQTTDGIFAVTNKAPARIVLEVLPSTLPADGISFATILARVYNDEGGLVKQDVQVLFGIELGPPGNSGSGLIQEQANTNTSGVAFSRLTAGLVPGTMTVRARAGNATASAVLTLLPLNPQGFTASATLAPGTTDAVDVNVVITDPNTFRQNVPVTLSALDNSGAALNATFQPPSQSNTVNGRFTTRAFLGPLSAQIAPLGLRGFIVVTIGNVTQLVPFNIPPSSTGGGGNQPPVFPNVVSFSPANAQFSVRDNTTLAIPFTAQFPRDAIGSAATFSLNPSFRTANAGGITGFFVSNGVSTGDTAQVVVSATGTATTTLVLTNVRTSQLSNGIVLAVNVNATPVVNGVPFQFFGSAPITLVPDVQPLSLLSLTARPNRISVSAGGSFSVTMTARVQAQDGSFPSGVFVTFGSDQSRGVIFPTTAATDNTGTATAIFSLSQIPANLLANGLFITLRATTPNSGNALTATTSIFVSPQFGAPDHLVLSSGIGNNPTTDVIFVQGSIFPTVTQITFDVLDINDNLARSSVDRVQFVLEDGGVRGGENLEPGSGTSTTTGALVLNGRASTVLRSGIRAGTVRVIAFIDNLIRNGRPDPGEPRSEPITVSISGGLPSGQNLSVVPQLLNIAGLIRAGLTDFITAFLADRFNNPVIAGTRVSFTSFDAVTLDSAAAITASTATGQGLSQGTATLISQEPTPPSGFVGVQAQTNSGTDATVLALMSDPARPNIVYAGSDGGGVYQGTFSPSGFLPFGNMAWQNVGTGRTGLSNGYVRALGLDPRPGLNGVVYAGTERGLFRSTGSGGIWIARSGRGRIENETPVPGASAPGINPTTFGLAFPAIPLRARTFVVDNGVRRFDFVFDSPTVIRFLQSPGATNPSPATLQVSYDYEQGIPELVPITAIAVSRNTPGGAAPTADNAIVYAGTLGAGVFRSSNGGFTWVPITAGLSNTNVISLAIARMPGNTADVVVLAGTQGGGVFKLVGGDPANPARAFRVVNEAGIADADVPSQLSWQPSNTSLTATHVLALATDADRPVNDGTAFRAYAGTDVGGVFRTVSNNLFDAPGAALTWAVAGRNVSASNLANTRVTAISVDPATRNVFATTLDDDDPRNPIGGLFRSTDAGNQFWPIGSPLSGIASPLQNSRLRSLTVGGGNLWVGGDGRQVWLSRNATDPVTANVSFTEVGRIGTLNTGTITVNPQIDNNIYDTTRVLFSGFPFVRITPLDSSTTIANAGFQSFLVTISDANGNPLPANTQVCITSSPKGVVSGGGTATGACPLVQGSASQIQLADTQQGGTDFAFTVVNDLATGDVALSDTGITIRVQATVLTPQGQRLATGEDSVARTLAAQQPLTLTHINPPSTTNAQEDFVISGGTAPFTLAVNGSGTASAVNGRTFSFTPTGANGTQYTLFVTDNSGRTVSQTFTVGLD